MARVIIAGRALPPVIALLAATSALASPSIQTINTKVALHATASCGAATDPIVRPPEAAELTAAPAAPGRLLVRFEPATGARIASARIDADGCLLMGRASLDAASHALRLRHAEPLVPEVDPRDAISLLVYDAPVAPAEAAVALRDLPGVVWAEPDLYRTVEMIPSDAGWPLQWAPPLIRGPEAWDLTTGVSGVVVAVIDTGIDPNQPDLQPNLWVNAVEEQGAPGVDDDQDGFVDDVHGWDFVDVPASAVPEFEDPGPPDADPADHHGHGTMVSGILGATGNDGRPAPNMAGVCWGCRLMAVRAAWSNKVGAGILSVSTWTRSLRYAADHGANVVNMSFGGNTTSQTEMDAIRYARARGVVLVAAAGNINSSSLFYPAAYPGVIAVAATDSSDVKAAFSNFGPWIDLSAPGVAIYSTWLNPLYMTFGGTSFASPHVAGVAALLLSLRPGLAPEAVEDLLKAGADDITALNDPGYAGLLGTGRVDAYRALVAGRLGLRNAAFGAGATTLTISGITVDPAATWLSFPGPFPRTVAPGAALFLDAVVDPSEASCGLQSTTITIDSDDPNRPTIPVSVDLRLDCDLDGDGRDCAALGGDDCDDADATAYPGAMERCNGPAACSGGGVDENCDGVTDEGCSCAGKPNAPAVNRPSYQDGVAHVDWRDLADNEAGFKLFRRKNKGDWKLLAKLPADATAYDDLTTMPGNTYTYGVKAYNKTGSSPRVAAPPITVPKGF